MAISLVTDPATPQILGGSNCRAVPFVLGIVHGYPEAGIRKHLPGGTGHCSSSSLGKPYR